MLTELCMKVKELLVLELSFIFLYFFPFLISSLLGFFEMHLIPFSNSPICLRKRLFWFISSDTQVKSNLHIVLGFHPRVSWKRISLFSNSSAFKALALFFSMVLRVFFFFLYFYLPVPTTHFQMIASGRTIMNLVTFFFFLLVDRCLVFF